MRASLIQRNISIMEDVLCGLQEKLVEVKAYRKELNQEIDNLTVEAFGDDEVMMVRKTYMTEAEKCSKFIRKCRKKIKAAEELQRALKLEAKDAARIDAWVREEDAFWLEQSYTARQDEYRVTYSYDELAKMFGEEG